MKKNEEFKPWDLHTSSQITPDKELSEQKQAHNTLTGVKNDAEKPNWSLLPFEALDEVAKVMTFGAKKYAAHNWRRGLIYSRLIAAALRHLTSFILGENLDPESGLSHLAHCACCILFLLTFVKTQTGEDDRFQYPAKTE